MPTGANSYKKYYESYKEAVFQTASFVLNKRIEN